MAPPRSNVYSTTVPLFLTCQPPTPAHGPVIADLLSTALKWSEMDFASLEIIEGNFSGKSNEQLAVYVAHTFGVPEAPQTSGAFVVLDDRGVEERYVSVVGLDMDFGRKVTREASGRALERWERIDGLVVGLVGFKYAIVVPMLVHADWKGISFYAEYAQGEDGNTGVLRRQHGEIDPDTGNPI